MQVETFRPANTGWAEALAGTAHDFYHGAPYHRLAEQQGEGEAHLVVLSEGAARVAWPVLVNPTPGADFRDATSVYGYVGPVVSPETTTDFVHTAWPRLCQAWRELGIVTLFTRFHPLLENAAFCAPDTAEAPASGPAVLELGPTVSIDARLDADAQRKAYPKILRQEIQSARRAGLDVIVDTSWRYFDEFAALYLETMQRNRAEDRYLFSRDALLALRAALGDAIELLVAHRAGELAAAMLFVSHGPFVHAHLAGVNDAFRAHSPLKLLIDALTDVARTRGAERVHLGAGRGGHEDGLFRFKSRFSPDRHPFCLGRWVLDPEAYATLCQAGGTEAEEANRRGYFPAYRAPTLLAPT